MAATITVPRRVVTGDQAVEFLVTGGPGHPADHVGLFPMGAPDTPLPAAWVYLNGTQTPPAVGLTSAALALAPPGFGTYEIRLFSPGTAGAAPIAVSPPVRLQYLTGARLGVGRLGAFRLKYAPTPSVGIIIGGVDRTRHIRLGSVIVRDVINDTPNTCTFIVNVAPVPVTGQAVILNYPGMVNGLFGGAIERVEEAYEGDRPAQLVWRVTCQDHTRQLSRRIIDRRYPQQSATSIAQDLCAGSGLDTTGIALDLPVVPGGLDVIDTPAREALTNLMQRIGGYWYCDYRKVVHAFLTETAAPPAPLLPWPQTPSLMNDPPVTFEEDITQLRTRVYVTGGGSTTVTPVSVGSALIPVQDATIFSAAGGSLKTGPVRLDFTGKVDGGYASNVGSSVATPSTAPTAALSATTVGKIVGVVRYKHTWKNSSGETLPGPASNAVTGVAFSPPTSGGGAPSAAAASGLGRLVGAYSWKYSYVTASGETTPGPASSPSLTLTGAFPPSAPSIGSAGLGPLVGTYTYRQTFVTAFGETSAGDPASRTAGAVASPGAPSPGGDTAVGPLIGTFNYRVSFLTAFGETLLGSAQGVTLAAQGAPSAPGVDMGGGPGPLIGAYSYLVSFVSATGETVGAASGFATATVVTASAPNISGDGTGQSIAYAVTYRHPVLGESALSARTVDTNKGTNPVVGVVGLPAGCGWIVYSSGTSPTAGTDPLFKVAELAAGVSTFTHTTQSGPQEGVTPSMGRYGTITSIPTGPPGTLARRIYRTRAGGSSYYLVGTISNNSSGQTFTDLTPDAALTQGAPLGTADGRTCTVAGIATGPSGTLGRRLYRTKAGGSTYFLIAQINDNSTTSVTDATPDGALTQGAPLTSAAGEAHTITLVAGPSGTTGRRLYRTAAGGTTARLVADVPDNSTSSITDAVPDTAIASSPVIPSVNTAGGQNATITGITAGPTGTIARRLYRTKAGGAEWFLVAQLSDNSTTSYTDSTPDASLGRTAPLLNDAGASAVTVTVPTGPAGTTSRRVYRTEAGTALYRLVTEIRDNTSTVIVDGKADSELGDVPPDVATIGALAGAAALTVLDASGFATAGWGRIDSQTIGWLGKSGNTLTGIAPTGVGSLRSAVSAGSSLVALPMLTGVTGLYLDLPQGEPVHVFVRRDDTAAQVALAAREGFGDGVIEFAISDGQLTALEATARADAELGLFARPLGRLRYVTRDLLTASGKRIAVNLPVLGIVGNYTIQSVTIDQVGIAKDRAAPRFTVEASTVRFSLADAFRRLVSGMGGF